MSFIREFGLNSGLFDEIGIKNYDKGITSPFELDIRLKNNSFKITNVGYGISQVLPIVVELYGSKNRVGFLIQQPEIHLHPRAQSALGDLVFKLAVKNEAVFIIETHSDFMIDRFRVACRNDDDNFKKISSQIVFFERFKGENRFSIINILQGGRLPEKQPENYRGFFLKEDLKVLGY